MEDKLTLDKAIAEILNWIKQDGDPEKSLKEIGNKVTSKERYQNCAQWILSRPEFQDWSKGWYPLEDRRASKRVIWINGPYGTGKTTIVYRVVSELQSLSEHYLQGEGANNEIPGNEGHPSRPMRVVPYFCTALTGESKRADYQTIIRALSRKISLLPDFTLAQRAEALHSQNNRGLQELVGILAWEEFLRGLLRDDKGTTDFVFVIDALDECDSSEEPVDSEKLLDFMRGLMGEFPNVQMLCSSRQHVPVQKYFGDEILYKVGALAAPAEGEIIKRPSPNLKKAPP
ncbi:hypothetical protein NA56DRAFT_357310 [Hyaloscypha hepaticicola]|uniref:Nephrocystin 3-like N-terminal domain-containing protein n=1 Tax=Hyaloscypha hepaticicola TaxID=2082293 RepID=A0A2J6PM52_9HELO|nr:hypothetical protein NA56DRAFT_357310 [Hyaloscypha hepaticicola]